MILLLSGLPRSGSSLLCAILRQNPDITAEGRSGLLPLLYDVDRAFTAGDAAPFLAAGGKADLRGDTLRALSRDYHGDATYAVDKSAFWAHPANGHLMEFMDHAKKIVVLVRDVREVMASWMKVYGETFNGIPTDEWVMTQPHMIDLPLQCVTQALDAGHGDRLHFLDYETLVTDPSAALASVYAAWGLPPFAHQFSDIDTSSVEDDTPYEVILHQVRSSISKEPNASVLGDAAVRYCESRNALMRAYGMTSEKAVS